MEAPEVACPGSRRLTRRRFGLPPSRCGHPSSVSPIAGAGTCCQSSVRSWRVWSKLSRGNGMGEPFFFFFPPPLIYKAFGSFSVIKMPLWDTR